MTDKTYKETMANLKEFLLRSKNRYLDEMSPRLTEKDLINRNVILMDFIEFMFKE